MKETTMKTGDEENGDAAIMRETEMRRCGDDEGNNIEGLLSETLSAVKLFLCECFFLFLKFNLFILFLIRHSILSDKPPK
jgi:hypothetical protein